MPEGAAPVCGDVAAQLRRRFGTGPPVNAACRSGCFVLLAACLSADLAKAAVEMLLELRDELLVTAPHFFENAL